MTLRLEIQKKMLERSPRVKAIDFHTDHPWLVIGLYSGTLALYDYTSNVPPLLPRPASAPSKPPPSPYAPSDSSFRISGLFAALMISIFASLTTTPWKK